MGCMIVESGCELEISTTPGSSPAGELIELRLRLQAAEQAVSEASGLLAKLDERIQQSSRHAIDPDTSSPGTRQDRLIPVVDWPKFHPWPKVSSLRHLIFNADHNGFDRVIRRVGARILLHERSFFQWIDERNGQPLEPELPLPTRRSRARSANKARSR